MCVCASLCASVGRNILPLRADTVVREPRCRVNANCMSSCGQALCACACRYAYVRLCARDSACVFVCPYMYVSLPKTVLYLIVVGGEQPSRGIPGGAIPSEVKAIG